MSEAGNVRVRWYGRGDLNAFWALFADNLANLLIIAGVLVGVVGLPQEIVFGRVLPGAAVSLLVGLSFYAWLAYKLARKTGRDDVTALPYGISTPVLFVYLFGVILPVKTATGDPIAAWQVGMAAAFAGGVLEAVGSVAGPWLKRNLPRAGMLGTLGGIALAFIATVPLAEVFEDPMVGLPATALVLFGLVAARRLPFGVPAGLAAIVVGTAIALFMGESTVTTEGVAVYLPVPVIGDLVQGFRLMAENSWILAVVVPVEVYNFVETMNNVESAEAAGDSYPVHTCQVMDGVGTMVGAIFGSAFPTTVYIGHPGYKRLGARGAYALGVGVVFGFGCVFGLLPFLSHLIPLAAVAPILVFVGVVIAGQAFTASPDRHAVAVALAMIPHLSALVVVKWGAFSAAVQTTVGAADGVLLSSPFMVDAMKQQGAHVVGQTALSGGSILVGLLWGSLAAFLIDGLLVRATVVAIVATLLTALGLVHASDLGLQSGPILWGYIGLVVVLGLLTLGERLEGRSDAGG